VYVQRNIVVRSRNHCCHGNDVTIFKARNSPTMSSIYCLRNDAACEDETDRLSRNVGKELQLHAA
jgi:hypothetical protein